MKIFVGYGYNERDKWVEDLVFTLMRAFDAEPISGKEIPGQKLDEGIKELIRKSDAVMGFVTRRGDKGAGGFYSTSRWVTDELSIANAMNVSFVEVREDGVDPRTGLALAGS